MTAGTGLAEPIAPAWSRWWLMAAGIYNLTWGAIVVLLPGWSLAVLGITSSGPGGADVATAAGMAGTLASLWGCIGMIVGVYGVGYLIAASNPLRHWPIVLCGLLGKVLGPVGFIMAANRGDLPWSMGWTLVTNDLVWWIPFGLILVRVYRRHTQRPA